MANDVFANGREISCKKADGKSICAFPDVCFTPPENPATPPGVPVPYPNTGMAKDMTSGSKNIKISGKEVMLKNKSYFKKSMGNEAGCAAKKGLATSVNKGKVYFISWSMDVKFEGENVVRHLDMTTHNHASPISNTASWSYVDRISIIEGENDCSGERDKFKEACEKEKDEKGYITCPCSEEAADINDAKKNTAEKKTIAKKKAMTEELEKELEKASKKASEKAKKKAMKKFNAKLSRAAKKNPEYIAANTELKKKWKVYAECMNEDECQKAAHCILVEKDPQEDSKSKGECCPPQTPHHIVPGSQFKKKGKSKAFNKEVMKYNYDKAPCICAEGENQTQASHGGLHFTTSDLTKKFLSEKKSDEPWTVDKAEGLGAEAVHKEFPQCSKECIQAQVRKKHDEMGIKENANIRPTTPGPVEHPMNDSSSH